MTVERNKPNQQININTIIWYDVFYNTLWNVDRSAGSSLENSCLQFIPNGFYKFSHKIACIEKYFYTCFHTNTNINTDMINMQCVLYALINGVYLYQGMYNFHKDFKKQVLMNNSIVLSICNVIVWFSYIRRLAEMFIGNRTHVFLHICRWWHILRLGSKHCNSDGRSKWIPRRTM